MIRRNLPFIIVCVVLVVAAGVGYWKRDQVNAYYLHVVRSKSLNPNAPEQPPGLPPDLPPLAVSPDSLPLSERPIERRRASRLPPPDSPRAKSDPLNYYVLKRRVVRTPNGVLAVSPGDTVELRERMKDGRMRVFVDGAQFVMDPGDLTQELDVARVAETSYLKSLTRQ
jgi:hypothetical protein